MPAKLMIQERRGRISISFHDLGDIESEETEISIPFEPLIKAKELEKIRWYLEDFLGTPFAVWEEQGTSIEELLPEWGQRLFECIFHDSRMLHIYKRILDGGPRLNFGFSPILLGFWACHGNF